MRVFTETTKVVHVELPEDEARHLEHALRKARGLIGNLSLDLRAPFVNAGGVDRLLALEMALQRTLD